TAASSTSTCASTGATDSTSSSTSTRAWAPSSALALENIAALFSWPGEELTEGQFLSELVERTGVRLLIDVANLHTNHVNRDEDPAEALAALPVEAIAYVHVAGGFERDGVWHDSHAHPVPRPVLDLLTDLASRTAPPGVLLERDENFPEPAELEGELTMIGDAVAAGRTRAAGSTGAGAAGGSAGGGVAVLARPTVRARERLAVAQAAVLSSLVAGTPVPEGFDRVRMGVQSRALASKRADVVAKVAPELPVILGAGYRAAFLDYARVRPMTGGYRRDALDFAGHLLKVNRPEDAGARRRLRAWWLDRAGPAPRSGGRVARAARRVLPRRA
ncbi:multinuclear nonheme iron-dependent oxidase, partial [Streptomyces sp. NPDC003233]